MRTPGNWEAIGAAVFTDEGREIVHSKHQTRSGTPEERRANALLIAASPRLFDACERAAELLASITSTSTELAPFQDSALRQLREAISAAVGES